MEINTLASQFQNLSLYELYRISVLLNQSLEDPERLAALRAQLRPGLKITYFDARENRLLSAEILELRQTRISVRREDNGEVWDIALACVNLAGVQSDLTPHSGQKLQRSQLKVGDEVGFYDRQNREVYGVIQRLNRKTLTLLTKDGQSWRVAYSLLFPVVQSRKTETGLTIQILPPE